MMGMDGMGLGMDDMWRTMYEVLFVTTELRQISPESMHLHPSPTIIHAHINTPHTHAHTHTHTHTHCKW